eukprot:scaffold47727_cov69-Phaeocystis_antarctica.AAC.3
MSAHHSLSAPARLVLSAKAAPGLRRESADERCEFAQRLDTPIATPGKHIAIRAQRQRPAAYVHQRLAPKAPTVTMRQNPSSLCNNGHSQRSTSVAVVPPSCSTKGMRAAPSARSDVQGLVLPKASPKKKKRTTPSTHVKQKMAFHTQAHPEANRVVGSACECNAPSFGANCRASAR